MTLRRQTLVVAAVLAVALACWIAALRGMSMMGGLAPFVGVWATTMAAMMLPSATPMIAAYAGIGGERASPVAFVLGYLAVWTTYGVAVYGIGRELPSWDRLAAVGLVLHGAWCAGCCTGLMVALLALGMSNLAWMAAVALLILAEKALPGGEALARVAGIALVVAGAVLLV